MRCIPRLVKSSHSTKDRLDITYEKLVKSDSCFGDTILSSPDDVDSVFEWITMHILYMDYADTAGWSTLHETVVQLAKSHDVEFFLFCLECMQDTAFKPLDVFTKNEPFIHGAFEDLEMIYSDELIAWFAVCAKKKACEGNWKNWRAFVLQLNDLRLEPPWMLIAASLFAQDHFRLLARTFPDLRPEEFEEAFMERTFVELLQQLHYPILGQELLNPIRSSDRCFSQLSNADMELLGKDIHTLMEVLEDNEHPIQVLNERLDSPCFASMDLRLLFIVLHLNNPELTAACGKDFFRSVEQLENFGEVFAYDLHCLFDTFPESMIIDLSDIILEKARHNSFMVSEDASFGFLWPIGKMIRQHRSQRLIDLYHRVFDLFTEEYKKNTMLVNDFQLQILVAFSDVSGVSALQERSQALKELVSDQWDTRANFYGDMANEPLEEEIHWNLRERLESMVV